MDYEMLTELDERELKALRKRIKKVLKDLKGDIPTKRLAIEVEIKDILNLIQAMLIPCEPISDHYYPVLNCPGYIEFAIAKS